MDKLITYLFLLSLVLVAVAYYVGLKSDAATIGAQANAILQTATGRNAAGTFASYPTGG